MRARKRGRASLSPPTKTAAPVCSGKQRLRLGEGEGDRGGTEERDRVCECVSVCMYIHVCVREAKCEGQRGQHGSRSLYGLRPRRGLLRGRAGSGTGQQVRQAEQS